MASKLGSTSRYWGALFVVIALFGFQWMSVDGGRVWLCTVYALIVAVIASAAWRFGDRARALLWRLGSLLPQLPVSVWIIAIIVLGGVLRVWVALVFPAELRSDPAAYAHLAQELVDGQPYSAPEGRAYWPPGLPLALMPLLILFGKHAILVYNLLAFALAEIAIFAFGRKLAGPTTALIGMFFIAVWPNFLFLAPFLTKEPLLIALWPAIAWFYLDASETSLRSPRIHFRLRRRRCARILGPRATVRHPAIGCVGPLQLFCDRSAAPRPRLPGGGRTWRRRDDIALGDPQL